MALKSQKTKYKSGESVDEQKEQLKYVLISQMFSNFA